MNASINRSYLVFFLLQFTWVVATQADVPAPNWDRTLALHAIDKADIQDRLKPLYQMAHEGSSTKLLESLLAIEQDPALPPPAQDYLVFSFTVGLGDLDPNTVAPEVLEYLSTYEAHALVAHEEHSDIAVPLFNVTAAAAGVRNHWYRQQAAAHAGKLSRGPADSWVSAYLAENQAGRRGFVDALEFASDTELRGLGQAALARLEERPELTLLTARAGLRSGDTKLLQQAIAHGGGPELSQALQAAARELSAEECIGLLDHSLRQGSDTKAALAIAHLAPARLDEPAVRQMLFSALSDRNLGAAAALVLGASPDPEVQRRLREIAAQDTGLAKKRAALAIQARQVEKEAEQ
ncbi:hypothetical protein ACFL33_03685 [Pseudomonadota bacterium]